jgi:D-serine deaminase-like pyridoxal phosphate-dependent protein
VDAPRCRRLAKLALRKTLRVAIDTPVAADALSAAAGEMSSRLGILVDLDVGYHRTGVQSPREALKLAQSIAERPQLRLDGLFFYPGHIAAALDEQLPELAAIAALLEETLDLFARSGLPAPIVSGGSTPTAYQSHRVPRQTEIRPGTYVYNDMNTVSRGFCALEDCAARLVCTVVSDAVPGKVVHDAGSKTLTSDRNAGDADAGFGHVVEFPRARIVRLSEEHGEVDVSACDERPRVGQRVHVIPNHICPCVNLQDSVWLRDGAGGLSPLAIDARGKLS